MKDTYKVIIYFFFPSLLFSFSYLLSLRSRSILKEKQRTKSTWFKEKIRNIFYLANMNVCISFYKSKVSQEHEFWAPGDELFATRHLLSPYFHKVRNTH